MKIYCKAHTRFYFLGRFTTVYVYVRNPSWYASQGRKSLYYYTMLFNIPQTQTHIRTNIHTAQKYIICMHTHSYYSWILVYAPKDILYIIKTKAPPTTQNEKKKTFCVTRDIVIKMKIIQLAKVMFHKFFSFFSLILSKDVILIYLNLDLRIFYFYLIFSSWDAFIYTHM